MKKYIIACLFLFGCAGCHTFDTVTVPPKNIRNPNCQDVPAVRVHDVSDTFALARVCSYNKYNDELSCLGHMVYIQKDKDKIYYDYQVIKPEQGQCIAYFDTYTYTYKHIDKDKNENKKKRTVPKIKFVNNQIENPEYQQYLKEKELKKNS